MAVTHVQLTKPAAKQDSIGEFGAFTTLWGRGPDSCGTLNKRGNWDRKQKHVAYSISCDCSTPILFICSMIRDPSDHAAAKRSLEVEL